MSRNLKVRAIRTRQGSDFEVFSFFVPGGRVAEIADISRIHRDEDEKLKGFQRKDIRNHIKAIVEYLDQGNCPVSERHYSGSSTRNHVYKISWSGTKGNSDLWRAWNLIHPHSRSR